MMGNSSAYWPGLKASLLKRFESCTLQALIDNGTGEVLSQASHTQTKVVLDVVEELKQRLRDAGEVEITLVFKDRAKAEQFTQDLQNSENTFGANDVDFLNAYEMKVQRTLLDFEGLPPMVTISTSRHSDWFDFVGRSEVFGQLPADYEPEETPLGAFLKETYGVEQYSMSAATPSTRREPVICPA